MLALDSQIEKWYSCPMQDKTYTQIHEEVDRAIQESIHESPASAGEIAEKTGVHKSLVARRFAKLGYVWIGGRWIYKHKEDHE